MIPAVILSSLLFLSNIAPAYAQTASTPQSSTDKGSASAEDSAPNSRLVMVLPFDNRSGQANLAWIGESFPEILNQRLASAGFLPIRRADRLFALDHLGLPLDFRPSRATTFRLAQTLGADDVIIGSYTLQNGKVTATAQIVNVHGTMMTAPVHSEATLDKLFDVENELAWRLAKQLDPAYSVAEQTFLATSNGLRLDAFENYIRGLVEPSPAERIVHLKESLALSPAYSPALLALGKAYFAAQQYEQAATILAKVPTVDPLALESRFYLGLAYFLSGRYPKAEESFAFVVSQLPLPEVVNNQGVAASRQGKDAVPYFERAIAADAHDADFSYNLAVAYRRRKDYARALSAVRQCLSIRPDDNDARTLETNLQLESAGKPIPPLAPKTPSTPIEAKGAAVPDPQPAEAFEPLERIQRNYNETSFRQVAFAMEQINSMRLSALPPAERASQLCKQGTDYLNQGLVLEAEREFQLALAADPSSVAGHSGLAQVREHTGDTNSAAQEAHASIALHPNAAAYLVLARIDLAANHPDSAAQSVRAALAIEPDNSAAKGLRQALTARGIQP